ncbi:hypothetical protein [Clostridium rhizosphaerae]|nr:hypothetical protein [Clostridium rhizosphaerae]
MKRKFGLTYKIVYDYQGTIEKLGMVLIIIDAMKPLIINSKIF